MAIGEGPQGFPVTLVGEGGGVQAVKLTDDSDALISEANPLKVTIPPLTSEGFETIASAALASSVGLTVPVGATIAVVQCEAQNVRWRDDGQAPTASVGMLLTAGSELTYDASGIDALRFIRVTAGATLMVSYFS